MLDQPVDELQLGLRKPSFDQMINNEDKLSQSHKLTWQQIGNFWLHIMVSLIMFLNNIVHVLLLGTVLSVVFVHYSHYRKIDFLLVKC